jgi:type I restriction enzyme S subunit
MQAGYHISNEFLYYKLLVLKSLMIERAIGSTFLEISKKDTAALEISIPEFDEQTVIAAVLSDMDEEIEALEQRLAKTRALKQGTMQQLLTGRTRLIQTR